MKAIQYTIRNVPSATDRRLRKIAKYSGKSLNEVVIDELQKATGTKNPHKSLIESLDWFIGANTIGQDTLDAWKEDDKIQKEITLKQWQEEDAD